MTFLEAVRSYLGVKFLHQGRHRSTGVDCVGLAACAAKDVGYIFKDNTSYEYDPNPDKMLKALLDSGILEVVYTKELQPGDILYMRFSNIPQHIAIYTDTNTIIHSYSKAGKVVEHRLDYIWKKRIVKVFRLIGDK